MSRLYETLDLKYIWPKPYVGAAAVYDGYLSDADGIVRGTIQVKVAKGKTDRRIGKFLAKVTATVQLADEPKKISFKGGVVDSDVRGLVSVMSAGGHILNAQVGEYGLGGTMDGLTIDGARNVFTGKYEGDGEFADAASGCMGVYNLAGGSGALSVSVTKKGKVKISGTVNGVKVSATSQLLVGNEVCCIPIVIAKKASLALNLLISKDGKSVMVQGAASQSWTAGKAGNVGLGAKFRMDGAAGVRALPGLFEAYLPNGIDVAASGTKWVVAGGAKAGKVAFVKGGNTIDESELGANPSGLKLSYKQKDGTFKGSFKVYCLEGNGKIKAYTANVTGVMIGAKGYGTATIKKPFTVIPITIE